MCNPKILSIYIEVGIRLFLVDYRIRNVILKENELKRFLGGLTKFGMVFRIKKIRIKIDAAVFPAHVFSKLFKIESFFSTVFLRQSFYDKVFQQKF